MLTNLILFSYTFLLLFSLGFLARIILSKVALVETSTSETSIDSYILFGFFLLTVLLSIISIFSKIGLVVHLIIFGLTFLGIVYFRSYFFILLFSYKSKICTLKGLPIYYLVMWPFLFLCIIYSASSIVIYDTGLYHAQFIQWIQSYKVIPGLAWIHDRFGFNSHFHLSCAFFNLSFLDIKNSSGAPIIYYPLNAFFLIIFLSRCIYMVYEGIKNRNFFRISIYCFLFVISFSAFGPSIQSPTPDIIISILIFYVFLFFIENSAPPQVDSGWSFSHLLLISIILVLPTFKLSAALIVLLIPFLLRSDKSLVKSSLFVVAVGCLIFIPYFVRNTIITGWLVYPFPQIDLFNFDWKIPTDNVLHMSQVIKSWARNRDGATDVVINMPYSQWIPIWWEHLKPYTYLDRLTINALYLNLCSPILFFLLIFNYRKNPVFKRYLAIYLVILLNLLFWFVNAPDLRFAFGFLYFNASFSLALIIGYFKNIWVPRITLLTSFIALLWVFEIPKEHSPYIVTASQREKILIYPKQIEFPLRELITTTDGSITFSKPTNGDRCFNLKIPCSPNPNPSIRLRGATFEKGFIGHK